MMCRKLCKCWGHWDQTNSIKVLSRGYKRTIIAIASSILSLANVCSLMSAALDCQD
jgi:hypothetical protein